MMMMMMMGEGKARERERRSLDAHGIWLCGGCGLCLLSGGLLLADDGGESRDDVGDADGADDVLRDALFGELLDAFRGVLGALRVADDVGEGEGEGGDDDDEPLELEEDEGPEEEEAPCDGGRVEAPPEEAPVSRRDGRGVVRRLEDPLRRAVLLDVVPPSEAHEEAARHVLDGPEVEREQEDADDAHDDEAPSQDLRDRIIKKHRQRLEEEVEERRPGMPRLLEQAQLAQRRAPRPLLGLAQKRRRRLHLRRRRRPRRPSHRRLVVLVLHVLRRQELQVVLPGSHVGSLLRSVVACLCAFSLCCVCAERRPCS
mmetsp:Transcript_28851/g.92927  ORF Transcript_28851/g.92927 Transcript_28851/m.92927 type:complete len:314 (-) Transcript_28851:8-949(-)